MKKSKNWIPEKIEDGDRIVCPMCGEKHTLFQAKINNCRIGDGILFYKCNQRAYMGAVNKLTILGVTYADDRDTGELDTDILEEEILSD